MRFCSIDNCSQPVFGTDKITRLGYCKRHQYSRTDLSRKSIMQRAIEKQKGIENDVRSLKTLPENLEMVIANKTDLSQNEWYAAQRLKMVGRCCNCSCYTAKNDNGRYKWSICHVMPKNIFKSVAMNDDNWIELCISCHTLFDRNLATASEMKCFKKAVEQFYKFQDKIAEHHKFLDLFIEYSNQL